MPTWTPTFAEVSQLLTALAAIAAVVVSLRNGRRINVIHLEMNSRFSEFLKTKHAEGFLLGRQRERLSPGTDELEHEKP